jgi:hypothetical protein
MVTVIAGTDTYGKIKKVGTTPIVTKFRMLWYFPIVPVASFYFAGIQHTATEGVPLGLRHETSVIHGIALARVDKFSVLIAFVRGFAVSMLLIGFLAIVPVVMRITGEHLDEIANGIMRALLGCFAFGAALGVVSYLLPFQVSSRERAIRGHCARVLGIAADLARARQDVAARLDRALDEARFGDGGHTAQRASETSQDHGLLLILVRTRVRIALGDAPEALEHRTDELLEAIRLREDVAT